MLEVKITAMIVILFRSRLAAAAGADYAAMDAELDRLVRNQPGFIDVKSFTAVDGERLTLVWWRDRETLAQWRNLPIHRQAQQTGRAKWYEYYKMEVAEIFRTSDFEREKSSAAKT
jgi:heme-degrading monooxygenase HmoA